MRLLLKLRSASAGCPAWLNVHVHQVIAAPALRVMWIAQSGPGRYYAA